MDRLLDCRSNRSVEHASRSGGVMNITIEDLEKFKKFLALKMQMNDRLARRLGFQHEAIDFIDSEDAALQRVYDIVDASESCIELFNPEAD